jgi:hypothetical protein
MPDTELEPTGQFTIRVRRGDWEIEVSAPDRDFVVMHSERLMDQLKGDAHSPNMSMGIITPGEDSALSNPTQQRTRKQQTINEFFRQSKLQTHLDKILVLGYWLEIRQGQKYFTLEDILEKYKEVRETPPANPRRDIGTLMTRGFLWQPNKNDSTYTITNSGIQEVESKTAQAGA